MKNPISESGFFNPRVLAAFALCSVSTLLAMLSFAANPPSGMTGLRADSPGGSLFVDKHASPSSSNATAAATTVSSGAVAWGFNSNGELGNGTTNDSSKSVQVLGLSGVTTIAGCAFHSLALKSDGTVWAWGSNHYGELGDGTTTQSTTPVPVSGLTGVIAIAGGGNNSLALKSDGTVWAWGRNNYGELGNGSTADSSTPVQVSGLTGVIAIATGFYHSLALKSDGTVWAWGANFYGQVGDGTTNNIRSTPVQVSNLTGTGVTVTAIACGGYYHSLALKSDGTVWAWGANGRGALGNGTIIDSSVPVQSLIAGVKAIAGGGFHSVALKSDGTVWAWGDGLDGELGNGTYVNSSTPVQVGGLTGLFTGVTAIASGFYHSVALKSDGTAWAWGYNAEGELGNPTYQSNPPNQFNDSNTPIQVSNLTRVTAIAGGGFHTLALAPPALPPLGWGDGNDGQTGNSSYPYGSITPVQVSDLTRVNAIAGGGFHSLALKFDGTVWAWGCPNFPCSRATDSLTPMQVTGLTNVIAVAAGFYHSLALASDGTVWAWGKNANGQLGNGSTTDSLTPVQVTFAPGVTITAIAGGGFHSLALDSNGVLWAWGAGGNGQLGNGTTTDSSVPVPSAMTGAIAIAGGYFSSYALKSDGTVWAWGYNGKGELGNGSTTGAASNSSTPAQVSGLTGVIAIAAGRGEFGDHALALKSDGTVWAWGYNGYGELGDGTNSGPQTCGGGFPCSSVPVQVSSLTGVTAIAAGGHHNLALLSGGTVWSWGENDFGQLGDGTAVAERDTPVQVSGLTGLIIAIAGGDLHSLALAQPPVPVYSVVSRKDHGSAGTFYINLPLTGTRGVECRGSGSTNDYTLVFTFANNLTSVASATVTSHDPASGTGSVLSSSLGPNANQYTVNLTGVSTGQYITVTLNSVLDVAGNSGNVLSPQMGVLVGDVNASGIVTSGDTNLCKAQALQAVTNANFRNDINASGAITTGDVNIIKQNALSQLPSPP